MKELFFKSMVYSIAFLFVISGSTLWSKSKIPDEKMMKEVVTTVGSENITYEILERAFQKNMNRKDLNICDISQDSIKEFLNLYINYRLKVMDAVDRKFDKDSSVISDIEQNRKILAETYYYEKKLMNPWLKKMLNYRTNEFKIAIIVFTFPSEPNPDTLKTYTKAKACLDMIKNGAEFSEVARDSSDDPESGRYGGVVQTWITSGNVQRPIENPILSLKEGAFYPELIKTRYGYFLVKLLKSEPRKFVKASHILLTFGENDTVEVQSKAESLLKQLKAGADFSKLASEFSKDKTSAENGGALEGYYSRSTGYEKTMRRLVPEFEEALFQLKDGEYSDIVKSVYGLHIIKRDSSKNFDPEIEEKDLKLTYKKSYYEEDKKAFLDSLHKSYGFKVNDNTFNQLISNMDTNKTNLDEQWVSKIPQELYPETIFTFLGNTTSVGEFVKLMSTTVELRGMGLNENGLNKAIDKIVTPMVIKEATKSLENEYPDFSALMQEFRDGILLFKVEQLEVWDKLKFDSVMAKQYWDTSKTKYQTKPKYDISEIYVLSDSLAKDIYSQLKAGADFADLAEKNSQRKGFREKKGNWGEVSVEENGLAKIIADKNASEGSLLEPVPYEKGFSIIKYNKFIPIRQKTFEEAISDFAPQFQDLMQKKLLKTWLDSVRMKFSVNINDKKIKEICSKLNKK